MGTHNEDRNRTIVEIVNRARTNPLHPLAWFLAPREQPGLLFCTGIIASRWGDRFCVGWQHFEFVPFQCVGACRRPFDSGSRCRSHSEARSPIRSASRVEPALFSTWPNRAGATLCMPVKSRWSPHIFGVLPFARREATRIGCAAVSVAALGESVSRRPPLVAAHVRPAGSVPTSACGFAELGERSRAAQFSDR